MSFRICSIASGSSGNSYLVSSDNTAVLVDAGVSGKKIIEGIEYAGVDPQNVKALLLTHEHIDHVRSVRVLSKKMPWLKVFCSGGTWSAISADCSNADCREVRDGKCFAVGDIEITPFALSHDAREPLGYSLENQERIITIHTDSGYVTERAHEVLKKSNLLVLESNHDVNTLQFCSYPYQTKRRILSDLGHLSNDACGLEILRIFEEDFGRFETDPPVVLLAHLSKETNFPEMAVTTVRSILEANGYFAGRHYYLHVLDRDRPSEVFMV